MFTTTRTPVLTDFELNALMNVAAAADAPPPEDQTASIGAPSGSQRKLDDLNRQRREQWEAKKKARLDEFTAAVNARLAKAYHDGASDAVDRADRSNFNARSITLYLVVLAVVAMPFIAMLAHLDPQTFGSYIAPVTGIAGTVVGYWFGALSRPAKYNDSAPLK
jgi:hypothetical protein